MKNLKLIGATLLIAGTTVGAGMVGLPVKTASAGLIPTILLFFICWGCMLASAFFVLELSIAIKGDNNFVTMAKKTLGMPGQIVCWITCLFLLYSVITAYLAGGGEMLIDSAELLFDHNLPEWFGAVPFAIIFGSFVYLGVKSVDNMNRIFMIGLVLSYILLVFLVTKHVDTNHFLRKDWSLTTMALPIIITAFAYQIIIPTLSNYLNKDVKKLKIAIIVGSLIPIVVYLIWELLVLGSVPFEGPISLKQALIEGKSSTYPLSKILGSTLITTIAQFFFFFAVVTSFLGASISLFDFLADGLKIKKSKRGRGIIFLLTFGPPLIFALLIPGAFYTALDYAGAFGCAILLALIPALMVWSKRYHKKMKSEYIVCGGKLLPIIVILFSVTAICLKLLEIVGVINFT